MAHATQDAPVSSEASARQNFTNAKRSFDIAPGQLEPALQKWANVADLDVIASGSHVKGLQTEGLSGVFTPEQALKKLLIASTLKYELTGPRSIAVYDPSAAQNARAQAGVTLPKINVRAPRRTRPVPPTAPAALAPPPARARPAETAYGPVPGYVASRSATATKTDTPLIETPQSISVVGRNQIEAQQADSMKQALRYTAGIASENRANFGGFDIMYSRGFPLNRYLDGMRIQGDALAVTPQPEIYGIERIEVLRGPSSVLFGQGSPGGLVNLTSKRPTETPLKEVVIQGGNFDRIQGGFDIGGPVDKNGNYLYRVTGFFKDAGNQVDFVKEQRAYIAPSFTWRPTKDTTWTVLLNYQNDPKAGYYNFVPYVGSAAPNPTGRVPVNFFAGDTSLNRVSREQYGATSLFEHRFGDVVTIRQNTHYMEMTGELNQVLPIDISGDGTTLFRAAQGTRDRIRALSTDTQAEAKFNTGPLEHKVLLGVDTQLTKLNERLAQDLGAPGISIFNPSYNLGVPNPINTPNSPGLITDSTQDQTQTQTGVYFQDQIKLGGLTVVGGARRDRAHSDTYTRDPINLTDGTVTQNDYATTGRIGGVYRFANGFAPYVVYATSFDPTAGTDANGQPFKPTTGELREAGIKFQPKGVNAFIQFSAFDMTQQNVVTQGPLLTRVQTGEITSRGYEIEAKASLSDSLDVIASYTRVNPKVTQSGDVDLGKVPLNVPREIAAAWADYTIRHGRFNGLGFGMGVRYVGETFADKANNVQVPSYTLVDAVLHYDLVNLDPSFKGVRLSVNATNLFDKTYVSQCTDLSLFGTPYANCVYGLSRQVIATLRYRW